MGRNFVSLCVFRGVFAGGIYLYCDPVHPQTGCYIGMGQGAGNAGLYGCILSVSGAGFFSGDGDERHRSSKGGAYQLFAGLAGGISSGHERVVF